MNFCTSSNETCLWYTAHPPFFFPPFSNIFTPQIRISCPPAYGGKPSPSSSTYHIAEKSVQQDELQPLFSLTVLLSLHYTLLRPHPLLSSIQPLSSLFSVLFHILITVFRRHPEALSCWHQMGNKNNLPSPSLPFSLHITILGFNTFMSTCSCVGSTAKFRLQSRQQHLPPSPPSSLPPTHTHLPS